jgi:hypothetical protein
MDIMKLLLVWLVSCVLNNPFVCVVTAVKLYRLECVSD